MTHRALRYFFLVIIYSVVCAAAQANSTPLINQPLVPAAVAPGSSAFTLAVGGTGFVSGAVVNWNGSARVTTFVSATQVTAAILASDVATAQTAVITVSNPAPGGGVSNGVFFQVTAPTIGLGFQESIISAGLHTSQSRPAVGDFNRDGKLDLAVPASDNTAHILLGNGDGTFQAPVSVTAAPAGARIYSIVVADFNGDGNPDLAVSYLDSTLSGNGISVVLGNGNGTFQPPVTSVVTTTSINTLANMILAADVNGDGKLDLVTACQVGVCVALGNGDGTFNPGFIWTSPVNTNGGPKVISVAVGDFNGDGKLDVAIAVEPIFLAVMLGNGDGTFGPVARIDSPGFTADSVVAADFNGDGKLDLAFYYQDTQNPPASTSAALNIYLGNGDGTFQAPVTLPGLPETIDNSVLIPGDFNGDGHMDLAVQNVVILIAYVNGGFSHNVVTTPHYASVAGDFNGDGRLDLASADHVNDQLHILLQTGPPPDFTGSLNPTYQNIVTGASATYTITISPIDAFTGTIQFAATGLPPGATASFNPPTVTGSGSTTLSITTSSSTPTGSYQLTVSGASGSLGHRGFVTLNVGPQGSNFGDFSGSVFPSYRTITPGSNAQYTLTVTPVFGFTGNVALSVSGLPPGATSSFTPSSISGGSGSSVLAITTSPSTATGTYVLSITGTSGSLVHTTTVNLNVGPAGTDFTDFGGSITPSSATISIAGGNSAVYTIAIFPINGFNAPVFFSQGNSPVPVNATSAVIYGGSGSIVITLTATSTSKPGTYPITIFANGGGHSHSENITLIITP